MAAGCNLENVIKLRIHLSYVSLSILELKEPTEYHADNEKKCLEWEKFAFQTAKGYGFFETY